MNKTKVELEYQLCDSTENGVPVIVVAAGSSSRMKGENKQFISLCGVPVLARTLMTFEASRYISRIILVVRDEDVFAAQMLCTKYGIQKVSDIVCGGKTRGDSVKKGFMRIAESEQRVLIHDGARPLVSEKIILAVVSALRKFVGAAPAVASKDTMKIADEAGVVISTPERNTLRAVQTPQGVRRTEYLKSLDDADTAKVTDDLSVLETAGYKCILVEGDYKNIKITTPDDVAIAEKYLTEENL